MRTKLFVLPLLLTACAKQEPPRVSVPNPIGPTVAPPSNVFLRNSFDTDPSRFIGRFVADGDVAIDESNSVQRSCGSHIKYSSIEAGGTQREELFRTSTSAALSVGVPVVAGGSTDGGREAAILIKYTETRKVVSTIDDPAAFATCCADSRNLCTGRYISEFIEGTGELYYAVGTQADFEAKGGYQTVSANVEFKHGMAWQRATKFEKPVYFAFKVSPTGIEAPAGGACMAIPDWSSNVPSSDTGKYFVGVSDPIKSVKESRGVAMLDARRQTVEFVGQRIKSHRTEQGGVSGDVAALDAAFQSQDVTDAAAEGLASFVAAEKWCDLEQPGINGAKYFQTYVLAFLPEAEYARAEEAVTQAAKLK